MGFLLAGLVSGLMPARTAQAGSYKLTEEDNRAVQVKHESKLYVKNSRGKTIIVGKKGADEISIRAVKFVRAKNYEAAQEWIKDLTFQVESDGEQVSIITHYPGRTGGQESFWAFLRGIRYKASVEYTIEVPSRFDTEVSSASGDVQVTSLDGGCSVFGSSGDVFLRTIGGAAFVEVSSGDVEVLGVRGNLEVRSSSGDAMIRDTGGSISLMASSGDMEVYSVSGDAIVELASGDFVLDGCEGSVVTRTVSGNAVLKDVLGSVRAVAGSGDVQMSILPVGEKEFIVNTSSGDVNVVFATPERYGFLLDVSTASGSIEGDLDIHLDKVSRRVLRGVVGTGRSKLTIETASGDIVIQQARRRK
jgi:DUF4097 and DUF4098 domain-containing protein YvlB